jgi:cytochrome c55X
MGAMCMPAEAFALALALAAAPAAAVGEAEPGPGRQQALLELLHQDCGSCHGLTLRGGLGPPLTPAALAGKPLAYLVQSILEGRPGTPMPPWRGVLNEAEARWLAEVLQRGGPSDAR